MRDHISRYNAYLFIDGRFGAMMNVSLTNEVRDTVLFIAWRLFLILFVVEGSCDFHT